MIEAWLWVFPGVLLGLLMLVAALHLLGRVGWADPFARAPLLDVVLAVLIAGPLIAGPVAAGWAGLLAAIAAQVVAVHVWTAAHELAHARRWRGPRIVTTLNRIVGKYRNYAALWVMTPAAPVFLLVRLAEMTIYPLLTRLTNLPRYRDGDWVNISRHKFDGLVGHDRIWCLYCDWMTGVWSLGSEMLRNIESFWCPIRFGAPGKCERAAQDFPDVDGRPGGPRWVDADGDIADVATLLEKQYAAPGPNAWFGHPVRLTVEGKDVGPSGGVGDQSRSRLS